MALLDRINKKVKSFLNTDGLGNYSPTDFELFVHDAIQTRYEELFSEITRTDNRQNRGLVSNFVDNAGDKLREKLRHYMVDEAALTQPDPLVPEYTLPADLNYIDGIFTSDGDYFELVRSAREFSITKQVARQKYPICLLKSSSVIKVFPAQDNPITISYLRRPLYPKWTYVSIDDNEVFDQTNPSFVDADIHPSEEDNIVAKVLRSFGMNLKEQDVQQYAIASETMERNNEQAI